MKTFVVMVVATFKKKNLNPNIPQPWIGQAYNIEVFVDATNIIDAGTAALEKARALAGKPHEHGWEAVDVAVAGMRVEAEKWEP